MFNKYQPKHLKHQRYKEEKKSLPTPFKFERIEHGAEIDYGTKFSNQTIAKLAAGFGFSSCVDGFTLYDASPVKPKPKCTVHEVTTYTELLKIDINSITAQPKQDLIERYRYEERTIATIPREMFNQILSVSQTYMSFEDNVEALKAFITKQANIEQRANKIQSVLND